MTNDEPCSSFAKGLCFYLLPRTKRFFSLPRWMSFSFLWRQNTIQFWSRSTVIIHRVQFRLHISPLRFYQAWRVQTHSHDTATSHLFLPLKRCHLTSRKKLINENESKWSVTGGKAVRKLFLSLLEFQREDNQVWWCLLSRFFYSFKSDSSNGDLFAQQNSESQCEKGSRKKDWKEGKFIYF